MIDYEKYNSMILELMSFYLNNCEKLFTKEQIQYVAENGLGEEKAYSLLIQNYFNIKDRDFINLYFNNLMHLLDKKAYINNDYYKNIKFNNNSIGDWELKYATYSPYELFVQDDFTYIDNRVIPNLGFFNDTFEYPAVYQNGRLWMSVTPNEINTMIDPINKAKGHVLTFGLGLGYFAHMCSLKNNVQSVTIVECDQNIIKLFNENILPQFEFKNKIKIVECDAYKFLQKMDDKTFDFVFVDIYHDAQDGMETYLKFKSYLNKFKDTQFNFWIDKTLKYYLPNEIK